ncbi:MULTISPECIES: hypothetical protein [Acidianus]|uniref:Uncharacterized protein n=1 Tax=Candidatus Acidianus copahuensis TaxID=1160895 RepID=A0A031LNJ9_9CREN|nr:MULTISPECIES: hypothetical protein [Acidianus]EZQ06581.1 hypothetical protein CM19_07240 [Candidatus Acidianus copahuensis]NON62456.1 hypothetical protein [Acidianus sp. RZ1]
MARLISVLTIIALAILLGGIIVGDLVLQNNSYSFTINVNPKSTLVTTINSPGKAVELNSENGVSIQGDNVVNLGNKVIIPPSTYNKIELVNSQDYTAKLMGEIFYVPSSFYQFLFPIIILAIGILGISLILRSFSLVKSRG